MMTRKDYMCMATALRRDYHSMHSCSDDVRTGWSNAVTALMNALKSDNRNFNEDIFLNYIRR